jgi:hypothetical protein
MAGVTPGDVQINSCVINSPRGSLDLTQSFLSSRVYESIFTQNNICEIDVFDTDDAISQLPILGDETINFSFNPPGISPVNYTFALDKAELTDITGTQKGKQYILHGVGQETLQSKANYIQKSYNTDISSIVQDIHTTFLKATTALITEATDGVQKLIIPNLKPFDAIDMVRRRAVSSSNPSSTFLYFENAQGHNFKTIEGMANAGTVKTFVHGDGIGSSIFNNTYNNIIAYDVPQIVSSTQRIAMGGLNQQVATYDHRTRQYVSNPIQLALGSMNSGAFKAAYGATAGLFSMIPWDSLLSPTNITTSTPQQLAYLSNMMQCYVNLKVNGDTTVMAGSTITLNIPEAITTTGTQALDPLISGNYLVSGINRNIGTVDVKPRYVDIIEALTPSLAAGQSSS